ncbi:HlyD family efflux transporter periplasmic adaptor subunit [Rhodocytophaga aerolata]|uniref:HlyD family efflux transporter periplasmic adaptor subunit n=1 Tax=Rhodocytophaga aerolata TaxID=455078 RepID=A0ABT8R9L2_9BACT|nr:HlyD family efflux transporter periplasmic adaptor subunit [Rhodocytophaga aerolata]MDO1448788.1 HlyD family efflux transporter periplasmic adaptor subunit [Rhodocytophaga aerolata]
MIPTDIEFTLADTQVSHTDRLTKQILSTRTGPSILADLSEKQYEELYHVDDAPIADVRQKALSRMGWWAVFLAITGAIAGCLVKFPDMIQIPFVVKSQVSEEIYRFPSSVYIEKILVKSGQVVEAGTPVLEISAPDIAALVNQYTLAQAKLNSFQNHKRLSSENEQTILQINIEKVKEDIRLKDVQKEGLEKKWAGEKVKLQYEVEEARRIYEANEQIYKTGDISKNDLHGLKANLLRAEQGYTTAYQNYLTERSSLQQAIVSGKLEVNSLEKQIAKTSNDLNLEAEQLQSSLASITKQIEGTFGAFEITTTHHLLLKAQKSGKVSFVFEGEKEAVPGTILLKLIVKDAPLYAYVQVNSSQIGKVKKGQPVVMKLDAYPVYEWGSVKGIVEEVSLTPDEKGMFNLRVQITNYNRLQQLVRIGMQGNGNIIFNERTLFGYIFIKFQKAASDLTE